MLQTAILQAWKGEEGLRQLPEEKIQAAVKWLRSTLAAPPKSYVVYMAAVGINPCNLPLRIGKLRFIAGDGEDAAALIVAMHANTMSQPYEDDQKAFMNKMITIYINTAYRNKTIIEMEVRAGMKRMQRKKPLPFAVKRSM